MNFRDFKKTRAVIDLGAAAYNYHYTVSVSHGARVAAVIKADAYGHGAIEVAKRLRDEGCDFFAVSSIDEALELRDNGIDGTVLILGYVLDNCLHYAVEQNISLAVDNTEHLKKIIEAAHGKDVKIHIKLDTGMNRTGFEVKDNALPPELEEAAKLILANKNLKLEGLFSHFAVADDDDGDEFSSVQYNRFLKTAELLENMGLEPKIKHMCNSAGIIKYGEKMHLDAVRMGLSLYGGNDKHPEYKPCMEFITTVINVHTLKKGESVSYGLTYTAEKDMKIAVIGAGYADGIKRCLSGGVGCVLINGKRAPFLGRICMDMSMVDISHIDEVSVGDDAVIFGKSGEEFLSCAEVAEKAGTIPYEIICAVSKRVPRVYK